MTRPPGIPAAHDNADGAARLLGSLHETFLNAGSRHGVEAFSDALQRGLAGSADRGLSLTGLSRFLDASINRAALLNDLIEFPPLLELLFTLFGSSSYFSDILVREPGLFRWLTASDALSASIQPGDLRTELERVAGAFERSERRMDAVRRLHRREILRTGTRDLLGLADLEDTTRSLSLLADAVIQAALDEAGARLKERYPEAPQTPFVVIGLGKLGGGELNYSSDVDLLFVYGEEGSLRTRGRSRPTHHEYFNRLAEQLIELLSRATQEGHLYRVDVRLRPESGAGPLARSLHSYMTYYESRGELWERQMLLKARAVAGDPDLGARFIASLEPFVFPRTFFHHPAEYVARIKARIEATAGDVRNVKLMPGGIRDVEFVVQTLQLLYAGKERPLRTVNTIGTIRQLRAHNVLSPDDETSLLEGYDFFRTLEHRLQTRLNTQTHVLPDAGPALDRLARSASHKNGDSLEEAVRHFSGRIRAVFDKVLGSGPAGPASDLLALLDGGATDARVGRFCETYKLTDRRGALKAIRVLTSGSALTGARELDTRVRDTFREAAPDLFTDIAATPDPDWTLANLTAMAGVSAFPEQMYRMLREDGFRRLITDICAMSPRVARGLASDPYLLDTLAADPSSFLTHEPAGGAGETTVYRVRQELRAGVLYVLGLADLPTVHSRLTAVADEIVRAVLTAETKKAKAPRAPLALFALGKYGSGELSFDADLDLVFLASPAGAEQGEKLQRLGSAVVRGLSRVTADGRLYDVDVRLRPEGRNSPLVANLRGYREYLRKRASLWERQSLTRMRFVAGNEAVAKEAGELVFHHLHEAPLPAGWVDTIASMRRRMETRSRTRGRQLFDLKLSPGGMADIEFIAQMIVLARGREAPDVQRTTDIINAAKGGELEQREAEELTAAYAAYRRVEAGLRLVLDERSTILPEGPRLERLARCLERGPGDAMEQRLTGTATAVRVTFNTFCARLESKGR